MKPKGIKSGLVVILLLALILVPWPYALSWQFPVSKVNAESRTLTTAADFEKGFYYGTESKSKNGDLKLTSEGSWNSRVWKTPNLTLSDGTAFASDGTYTYMLIYRDNRLSRYRPAEDRWETLARAPYSVNSGADMVYLKGNIYVGFGGYQKKFARYSIATNSWAVMADFKELVFSGHSLATDGTDIYALRGGNTMDFWKYEVANNRWVILSNAPATMYLGADLIYVNYLGTNYLYTPRGNSTTFYRYNIDTLSWETMAPLLTSVADNGNITKRGDYIYMLRGGAQTNFYRYSIVDNQWTSLTSTPTATRYVGVTYNAYEDLIYVFQGNNTYNWWKFDPDLGATGTYLGEVDLPATPGSGADLIFKNDTLYFRRGRNTGTYYTYNITTDIWTTRDPAPSSATFNDDNKGILAGDYIYYYQGSGTSNFYRYNTLTNTWETRQTTLNPINYGASLAYTGSGNYLYGTRGGINNNFYRYNISSNSWLAMASLPTDSETGYGSRLVSDGTYIYAITGGGIGRLLRYTIAPGDGIGSWEVIGNTPFAPYWGTDVVFYNNKIYAISGYYRTDIWEYTIGGSWRRLQDMPGYYAYNYGPYNGGSISSDNNGTFYIINGQDITRLLSYTITTKNYPTSGYWESEILNLDYVDSWETLTLETALPSGSSIAIQGQSSSDLVNWTDYYPINNGVFDENIVVNPYLRLKVILNSGTDQLTTPSLAELKINYKGDEEPPTNPNVSSLVAKSQAVGGTILTSGESYGFTNPYFSWSDRGSDNQTEVEGYYLYFGDSIVEDDVNNYSYQTELDYTVNKPLSTGTYYLRIKTIDSAGNIADGETLFTYVYNGASPPANFPVTSTSDFNEGQLDSVSTANNKIRLESKPGFWQQERLTPITAGINYGAGFAYVESTNKLYTFRGNATTFYEYDIDTDTWTTRTSGLESVYQGGEVVEGPEGYLYGFPGKNTNKFWVYDINANQWNDENAQDALGNIFYGSSAVYDNEQYIYLLRGGSDNDFYRYDTSVEGGSWEGLEPANFGAPAESYNNNVYVGGDMAYDKKGTIYAIQGYYRGGFASYDTNGNNWSQLPQLPSQPYNGAQIEYDETTNAIYYLKGANDPNFFKYDISENEWSALPDAPENITTGASMRVANGVLYILRGGTSFYKFNIAKNSWMTPTTNIYGQEFRGIDSIDFYYGAQIIKGNDQWYYLARGNYDSRWSRYNAATGISEQLSGAPTGFFTGSSITYNEDEGTKGTIYIVGSQYDPFLYKYDIENDSWSQVSTDPLPYDSGHGSSMEYDGTRYIYWTRGGNQANFYRYDTQASPTQRWESLANATATLGYGSHLVYKNGYVYTLRGNNIASNPFYRYSPAPEDTWATMAPLPIDVYNDGFLVDGGGNYLLACKGENTSDCYRYTIDPQGGIGSWESVQNAPANIYMGGASASNKTDRMYVIAGASGATGAATNTFANGLYSYIFQTENSSFAESGSYISTSHHLEGLYKFANLDIVYETATNSALAVYTQTSSDNTNWSTWSKATEEKILGVHYTYKINSAVKPYLKVKFELTSSDGIYSSVIDDYAINYFVDSDPPVNPGLAGFKAYTTATKSAEITTGQWGKYANPHFTWADREQAYGASDGVGGSGVAGYYVDFSTTLGTNASESGVFVTSPQYTASNLVSDQTYYLKIQAIDDAGNFAETTWQPFVYKYDNVVPTNPTTIVVNPSGYTNVNNYTFTWTGATDSASLIKKYWYKAGPNGSESATLETTVSGVTKYQTGTNTFYLQVEDYAGNRASGWVTASYYYSGTAAGAPQNLRITHPASTNENTVNEFAFAWDPPSLFFGQQSALRYHYWINIYPGAGTAENALGMSQSTLSKGSYAQNSGDNVLRVVAEDEAGNIDYNNYAELIFKSKTSAPGAVRNLDISDVSIKETEEWRLALSWDAPVASGSGIAEYRIYRSAKEDAVCPTDPEESSDFSFIDSTKKTFYVDSGLTQETKYYCVTACNYIGGKGCGVGSDTVNLFPDGRWRVASSLVASPSAEVKTKTAVITWSTNRTSNSFVKYGKSAGTYGDETGSSTQVTAHSVELTGLEPGTTYYFKALWTDEDGNTGTSDEISFTTNPAPAVSDVKATNVSIYGAYINFTISNSIKATVEYGKTLNYGGMETISTAKNESTYMVNLKNLVEGTSYNFRIKAEDDEANTYYSDNYTFETLPVPKITTLKVQQVVGMPTATIRAIWASNTSISSIITYYPSKYPERAKDYINLELKKAHEAIIKDLMDETEYTLIITGKDLAGNQAEYPAQKVTTATDFRPPLIENFNIDTTIVGVGDQARAKLVITWDTDEPATTQIEYAQGTAGTYSQTTQEDKTLTSNHTVTITGLAPATIYHLRALSKDKAKNIAKSSDSVIITPKSTKGALELVIDNLSKSFGFLKGVSVK